MINNRGINYNKYKRISKSINKILLFILILCFYYYSYRYIFQYNSETTSPTYSNTPESFKLAKYIVLLLLIIALIVVEIRKGCRFRTFRAKRVAVLLSFWSILMLIHGFVFEEYDSAKVVLGYFLCIILIQYGRFEINLETICIFFKYFFIYSVLYEGVQIVLFFLIGRLPALAYENSISVRFGGPWDDPNGFGIMLSFYLPFLYWYIKKTSYKVVSLVLCLLMLFLSQSGTAVISVFISTFLSYLIYRETPTYVKLFQIIGLLFLAVVSYGFILSIDLFQEFLTLKSGSVEGHADSYTYFANMDFVEFVIGLGHFDGESSIIELISRWGIFYYLLFLYIMVSNLIVIYRITKIRNSPLWMGAFNYQLCFIFAMSNIPLLRIFYMSLFSSLIIGISEIYYSNIIYDRACEKKIISR